MPTAKAIIVHKSLKRVPTFATKSEEEAEGIVTIESIFDNYANNSRPLLPKPFNKKVGDYYYYKKSKKWCQVCFPDIINP